MHKNVTLKKMAGFFLLMSIFSLAATGPLFAGEKTQEIHPSIADIVINFFNQIFGHDEVKTDAQVPNAVDVRESVRETKSEDDKVLAKEDAANQPVFQTQTQN